MICSGCGEIIEFGGDTHIHHDTNSCGWIPSFISSTPLQDEQEVLLHEITCRHQLWYHSHCCKRCGADLAGV